MTIPEAERDQELSAKLKAEWPGILRWMIDGCLMWQRDGLNPPDVVKDATDSYLTGQDDLQQFIDDACVTGANQSDTSAHYGTAGPIGLKITTSSSGHNGVSAIDYRTRLHPRGESGKSGTRTIRGIRCIRENAKKMAAEVRKRAEEARAREAEAKARSAEDRAAGNAGDMDDIPF